MIELALVGHNGDKPLSLRQAAERFGVSTSSLHRHLKAGHLSQELVRAKDTLKTIQTEVLGNGVLAQMHVLQEKAMVWLEKAEKEEEPRLVALFIREARDCLRLQAELEKKIGPVQMTVNVMTDPEFIMITDRMYKILEPYPDIRAEIAAAMEVPV
jgi:hypothetical protein